MGAQGKNTNAFDAVAPFYDELMTHVNYPGWVRETRSVAACIERDGLDVLDLACGTATFVVELARKTGWHVVGLDSSVEMIRCGRDKLEPGDQVHLIVANMERPALRGGFDVIVSLFDSVNFVLTLPELQDMFAEVYRLLAPGGIFFSTLSRNAMWSVISKASRGKRRSKAQHVNGRARTIRPANSCTPRSTFGM